MILVTGAAGKTGRSLIAALSSRGAPVRALVRRGEQSAQLTESGATECVVGDLLDQDRLLQAARGVRAIYHICPNMHPREVSIGAAAIAAARAAQVEHFVYHSVLHPQTQEMPHHWNKLLVEEMLLRSDLAVTILQPSTYMQNLLVHRRPLFDDGIYPIPYAAETRLNMVDLLDVAAVAATVLTSSGHAGAVYELAGPDNLTQTEVAGELGAVLGRPVSVSPVERAQWAVSARARGVGDYAIQTLLAMFEYYERHGFIGNANVLSWLLGRPPTSFSEFARRALAPQDGDG